MASSFTGYYSNEFLFSDRYNTIVELQLAIRDIIRSIVGRSVLKPKTKVFRRAHKCNEQNVDLLEHLLRLVIIFCTVLISVFGKQRKVICNSRKICYKCSIFIY